ncbi:MAG: LysM peptidoglycan-binding domain-containing protein [Bdellovibrio sp.]|nr:LysM peptidoglycan-binding domain-containing protein [Bdellovibrio sp.]
MKNLILVFSASLLVFGCAHNETKSDGVAATANIGEPTKFRMSDVAPEKPSEELEIIPTELNANVDKWINYFQGRGRPHMERYLLRSTRYEALMKKVLRDNKLPEDLFYIALIESGFSSQAFSHASAVGYWQFIRGTGKQYKLQINQLIDERRDPVLSTQAAAQYFKDLYTRFNSWYLAMAAYNVGEGRVDRAVKKYKTRDFWLLTKNKHALPRETDDYIPKYIAAKLIAKNPDKYGFEGVDYMPPIEFDHVTLNQPVNLRLMAEKMNVNYEDFKALNPKFKGEIAPLDADNVLGLRIPPGSYELAMGAAKESITDKIEYVADQDEIQPYKIRKGDTFSTIARRYKTTVAYLRDINDFARKKKLRVGQKIFVPDRTPLKEKRPELQAAKVYIVQPGDSLASIATKYKVSVNDLKKANNLSRKSKIKSGVKLILPENAVMEQKLQKNSSSQHKTKNQKVAGSGKKHKRNVASKN